MNDMTTDPILGVPVVNKMGDKGPGLNLTVCETVA